MFSKPFPAKALLVAAVLVVGAGSATAATASSIGGAASSVPSVHPHAPGAPSPKSVSTSAAHTPAPTVTSGTSQRQGKGPNVDALPGLCRAQIASAGHPNPNSVVPSINCSGVTPAGPASSSTSSSPTGHDASSGASAGGTNGVGAVDSGRGRP